MSQMILPKCREKFPIHFHIQCDIAKPSTQGKGLIYMGKIICPIRLGVLVLLYASSVASAKMEFPPELKDAEAYSRFSSQIRKLVPETQTASSYALNQASLEAYIGMEQQLVKELKGNPEYMALADQRPPLQTLNLKSVTVREVLGKGASAQWRKFLEDNGFAQVSADLKQELANLFKEWSRASLRGFFSGWAGFLGKDARDVLKIQDPIQRWTEIKQRLSGRDIVELRQKFKAEKFGVQKKDWTWSDLDKAVERMNQLETRVAVLMQQLNLARAARGEAWFHKDNVYEWGSLPELDERAEALLGGLKDQLSSVYTDPNARTVEEVVEREFILKELPPYLAIYRGCVGYDCSTTHSWAHPYAPTERNWWVETKEGRRLAYISGAITIVNGDKSLYIRDLAGHGLQVEDVPVILNALFLARSFYGAKHMTLMAEGFTSQNHRHEIKEALRAYGGVAGIINQTFVDARIRDLLAARPSSTASYDSISTHTSVRMILPSKEALEFVRVSREGQVSLAAQDPNKSPEALWQYLHDTVLSSDTSNLQNTYERKVDWEEVVYVLRNDNALPINKYYMAVEEIFEKHKLPFSRNMMKKNEGLFLTGHLQAPDAWKGDNVRQSVRYLMDLIWRRKGMEDQARELVHNNLKMLEENELMVRNVKGLFARRQADDIARIELLFSAGFRFTKVDLLPEELTWLSEVGSIEVINLAVKKMLGTKKKFTEANATPGIAQAVARLLNNEDESVDENISIEAARTFYEIPRLIIMSHFVLAEALTSVKEDDNPEIRVPLALAFLRDVGSPQAQVEFARIALHEVIDDNTVPARWREEVTRMAGPRPDNMPERCERVLEAPARIRAAPRRSRR
jgi:hypothetical protein